MKRVVAAILTVLALQSAYARAKNPNFNIKNKTPDNITIKVTPQSFRKSLMSIHYVPYKLYNTDKNKPIKTASYALGTPVRLQKDRSFSLGLEVEDDMAGTIYDLDVTYTDKNHEPQTLHTAIELKPDGVFYIKAFNKGSVFTLAPQEGRLGKTTEGYSLKNNVKVINPDPAAISFKADDIINLE